MTLTALVVPDNKLAKLSRLGDLPNLVCMTSLQLSISNSLFVEVSLTTILVLNATNNQITKVKLERSCPTLSALVLKQNELKAVPKDLPPSLRTLGESKLTIFC